MINYISVVVKPSKKELKDCIQIDVVTSYKSQLYNANIFITKEEMDKFDIVFDLMFEAMQIELKKIMKEDMENKERKNPEPKFKLLEGGKD